MVTIPEHVKNFFETQGIFAVGSVGDDNIANVSPRIFFKIEDNVIYWLDFFHHKSFKNFKANPWVSVAAYDKETLTGYQIRGKITFIDDKVLKEKIKNCIISKILTQNPSKKVQKLCSKNCEVIMFEPKIIYSLNPEKFSDLSIGSDVDSTKIFE